MWTFIHWLTSLFHKTEALVFPSEPISEEERKAVENVFKEIDKKLNHDGTRKQKKNDCTKLTQFHYDYLSKLYTAFLTRNRAAKPGEKMTQVELTIIANARMGTDKSRTSLAKVWTGDTKREELPMGKPYFTYNIDQDLQG